jgi:GntR family transcriptional activator of glc operon
MVAQKILGQISAWRLRVGDALPGERHLSTELGVSRTAVREALKFLSAKGVVEVSHGRKTVIASDPSLPLRESLQRFPSSDAIILNLFEVRESFEADIAGLAARRATASQVEQLAQLVDQMKALPAAAERSAFVKLDLAFHNLLAQSTRNPVFSTLLQSIRELIVQSRYRDISLKHDRSCTKDHERIFLAIRDRDASRARSAMKKHIREVRASFARAVALLGREADRKEVSSIGRTAPARWG